MPQIKLSDFGKIVKFEWYKSFEIRKELFLHEYITMPNHLHAIVEINNDSNSAPAETHGRAYLQRASNNFGNDKTDDNNDTHDRAYQRQFDNLEIPSIKRNPPIRLPKSISSFIAGFKSAVNTKIDNYIDENQLKIPKYSRKNHFFQPNYHDHIIRNERQFNNISNYIKNNPLNWTKDLFH